MWDVITLFRFQDKALHGVVWIYVRTHSLFTASSVLCIQTTERCTTKSKACISVIKEEHTYFQDFHINMCLDVCTYCNTNFLKRGVWRRDEGGCVPKVKQIGHKWKYLAIIPVLKAARTKQEFLTGHENKWERKIRVFLWNIDNKSDFCHWLTHLNPLSPGIC